MKYNPPVGGGDDDPYVDGNPAAGIEGTAVPAAAIEYPQREIVNVIAGAGLGPNNNDQTQLLAAIEALIAAAVAGAPLPDLPAEAQPGTMRPTFSATAQDGWLIMDDGTIGPAASAASHADDSYVDVYTALWNSVGNAYAPVTGGRGVSAAADWAANKPLQLPLTRGRAPLGAGAGATLTARTLGATGGEENHALTKDEGPNHDHKVTVYDKSATETNRSPVQLIQDDDYNLSSAVWTTTSSGNGDPHNNMQPFFVCNWEIKI